MAVIRFYVRPGSVMMCVVGVWFLIALAMILMTTTEIRAHLIQNRVSKLAGGIDGRACAILEPSGALKCWGKWAYVKAGADLDYEAGFVVTSGYDLEAGDRPESMGNALPFMAGLDSNVTDVAISAQVSSGSPEASSLCVIHAARVKCLAHAEAEGSTYGRSMVSLDFGGRQVQSIFANPSYASFCGVVKLNATADGVICWGTWGDQFGAFPPDITLTSLPSQPTIEFGLNEQITTVVLSPTATCVHFSPSGRIKCWGRYFAVSTQADLKTDLAFEISPFTGMPIVADSIAPDVSFTVNISRRYLYVQRSDKHVCGDPVIHLDPSLLPCADFSSIPGFGTPSQVLATTQMVCAISTSKKMACIGESSLSAAYLGQGRRESGYSLSAISKPIDFGSGIGIDQAVVVLDDTNTVGNSLAVCTFGSSPDGQVRCFGSNANGVLGGGILDKNEIIGDEPGEMGDSLSVVDLGGCGYGSFAVNASSSLISSRTTQINALAPIDYPYGSPVECSRSFADVSMNITLSVSAEFSNPSRPGQLFNVTTGPAPSRTYSGVEPWRIATCPSGVSQLYYPLGSQQFVVFAFTPTESAAYTMSEVNSTYSSVSFDFRNWDFVSIYSCGPSGVLTQVFCRVVFIPLSFSVHLTKGVTYRIAVGSYTSSPFTLSLSVSSTLTRTGAFDRTWNLSQPSFSAPVLTMLPKSIPMLTSTSLAAVRLGLTASESAIRLLVPSPGYYRVKVPHFYGELAADILANKVSAEASLTLVIANSSALVRVDGVSASFPTSASGGDAIVDISAYLQSNVEYILVFHIWRSPSFPLLLVANPAQLEVRFEATLWNSTATIQSGYKCVRCPFTNVPSEVGLSTPTAYSAAGIDACTPGLSIIYVLGQSVSINTMGTRFSFFFGIKNIMFPAKTIALGLSKFRTPHYVTEVWLSEPSRKRLVLLGRNNGALLLSTLTASYFTNIIEVVLSSDLMSVGSDLPVSFPLLWWDPLDASISPSNDANKYGQLVEFTLINEPAAIVSPREITYVLDSGKIYEAADLAPPLVISISLGASAILSADPFYRIVHNCVDGVPRLEDEIAPDFIVWNAAIGIPLSRRPEQGYSSTQFGYLRGGRVDITASRIIGWTGNARRCSDTELDSTLRLLGVSLSCHDISSGVAGSMQTFNTMDGIPRTFFFAHAAEVHVRLVAPDPTDNLITVSLLHDQTLRDSSAFEKAYLDQTGTEQWEAYLGYCNATDRCGNDCAGDHNLNPCRRYTEFVAVPNRLYRLVTPVNAPYVLSWVPRPDLHTKYEEQASADVPVTRKSCIRVQTKTPSRTDGTVYQSNTDINITIIFRGPCRRGTYSVSGTNQDGCTECLKGSYQSLEGQTVCIPCPINRPITSRSGASSRSHCRPAPGNYEDLSGNILTCPRGGNCSEPGVTLQTLPLVGGFWRTGVNSSAIVQCRRRAYCTGGSFPLDGIQGGRRLAVPDDTSLQGALCHPSHYGVMCESCFPGHSKQGPQRLCVPCTNEQVSSDRARVIGLVSGGVILFFLAVLALFAFSSRMQETPMMAVDGNTNPKQTRSFYILLDFLVKVRVLVGRFQVIGAMAVVFAPSLPEFFAGIAQLFTFMALDIIALLDFGCSIEENNFYSSLLASTLMPMAVAFVIVVAHVLVVEVRRSKMSRKALERGRNRAWTCLLVLVFLVYPSVSQRVLSTFNCRSFDDGSVILVADPSLSCLTDQYRSYYGYAIFMTLLYVVGIPLSQAIMLYRRRKVLMALDDQGKLRAGSVVQEDPSINRLIFLWRPYKPRYFFFEVVETLRKLLQTAILVFVGSGTSIQMIYQTTIVILFVSAMQQFDPYKTVANNFLAILSQWSIFFISFLTLLIKLDTDSSAVQGYNIDTLNALLIALVFLDPCIAVIQSLDELGVFDCFMVRLRRTFVSWGFPDSSATVMVSDEAQALRPALHDNDKQTSTVESLVVATAPVT